MRSRTVTYFILGVLAVALASGGVGYAAGQLPKNSVGTKQLKNKAVKTSKIKNNAVSSSKVAGNAVSGPKVLDNSLTGADIDESTLTLPPTPGTQVFSGYDFTPTGSDLEYLVTSNGYLIPQGAGGQFVTRLEVPLGTTISSLTVSYVDGDGGNSDFLFATVNEFDVVAGTLNELDVLFSDGIDGQSTITDTVIGVGATLTPQSRSYTLKVSLPLGFELYGAAVTYSLPS
jgi:hypothetical protein